MATRIAAAEALTFAAATEMDKTGKVTLKASEAKLMTGEAAVFCSERGVQIHGGYGFIKDYRAEKYYRDAKICTIGEGTSEVQRLVIARELLSGMSRDAVPGPLGRGSRGPPRPPAPARDARRGAGDLDRRTWRRAGRPSSCGRVYAATGRARVIGITGPPGAGKSTLVDRLAQECRRRGETVGILCVDPTSPFTGGALLGDRIRMQGLATDPRVFIRSMATRGAMGGLARATRDAADLLDAAGFDWVIIETVGVGQDEVDVVSSVDTVLVVAVPGLGDDIQAIKAGILEIADIFVLNKADRDGADRVAHDLEMMLSLGHHGHHGAPRPACHSRDHAGHHGRGDRRGATRAGGAAAGLLDAADPAHRGEPRRRDRRASRRHRAPPRPSRGVGGARDAPARPAEAPGGDDPQGARARCRRAARRLRARDRARARRAHRSLCALGGALLGSASRPSGAFGNSGRVRMIQRIDHIGIAVVSIAEARVFYEAMGLVVEAIEEVPQEGVRVAMIRCGESKIELLEATSPDSPIARFLEKRGPGIHHLCFASDDLHHDDLMLRDAGVQLLRPEPTQGAGGCWVQFVHPKSAGGVLVELSQGEHA